MSLQPFNLSTVQLKNIFQNKKVFLTGHTGFKGSWLCEWLLLLGAEVSGFSLPGCVTSPSLFEQLGLASRMKDVRGDVRDAEAVRESLLQADPDFVFHLAAQPLVRLSYREPVETFTTNVMGTIHVLEAMRGLKRACSAVMVTTDKCYENREWERGYHEEDVLGGHDPYSSSKAACEVAIASWRRSFFQRHPVRIASARAGNVIGGGDWAEDRILPDSIRALQRGEAVPVRNQNSTRPWQHVLEPLSGYLLLAARLASQVENGRVKDSLDSAFNFGPGLDSNRSVMELVREILKHWPGEWVDRSSSEAVHEAGKLNLATDKACRLLGWKPRWDFTATVANTVDWYHRAWQGEGIHVLSMEQIRNYMETEML